MILSGLDIKKNMGTNIIIDPFCESRLNPNSYNLKLHNELMIYDEPVLDMKRNHKTKTIEIPTEGLLIKPGKLYLGRTVEYTKTYNFIPMLEGRSSVGRLGLAIHVTAGFGDVGFEGYWTLEIQCIEPIIIYPFVEVCQIYYHTISEDHATYTNGKYQKNRSIQASMLYKDFEDNYGI